MAIPEEGYFSTELASLEKARNYYAAILKYFTPYLRGEVVEVGAGIGTFSQHILKCPQITALTVIEPATNLFPILVRNLAQDSKVRYVNGTLQNVASSLSCDSVVLINVLEHLEDDEETLGSIQQILKPEGTLLLFVPALPWLYGSLDESFGHFRRYRKLELDSLLTKVGFQVKLLRYFNILGILTWFISARIIRCRSLNPFTVWIYDRFIMNWMPQLEHKWEPALGQSLLVIATKPLTFPGC